MSEEINNNIVKVNKFTLNPKGSTGFHLHALDYVIIPITDGCLKLINKNKHESFANLKAGKPYFRKKGIEHNVVNIGSKTIIFIEVEIKDN